ncbi:sulfoquinovosidase-like isoform X2 [Daphnia pulicaria]|uniref:sulfoquinovosidase-like isoform X2 n=1 Tax=Daphnia pulicaria TaxID=35523 RepID=UPI001EEB148E|nr:sulfoquinovosidase-like isoform X2 [Daphnia pulicaria]
MFTHVVLQLFKCLTKTLKLIEHNGVEPAIAVGSSNTNFTEDQGNFIINEDIFEKIELSTCDTDQSGMPTLFKARCYNAEYFPEIVVDVVVEEKDSTLFRKFAVINVTLSGRDRLWFRLASNSTEKIYGAGEQFTYLNLKGREFPMWIREQGVGRNLSSPLTQIVESGSPGAGGDYHTTYYPAPIFLSTWNYVISGKQKRYSILNFTSPTRKEIYVHDNELILNVGTAANLMELVNGINLEVSRISPILPQWIYNGAIIAVQGGTQNMLDKLQQCLDNGVKVSAIWIQDWAGKIVTSFGYRVFWNWRWNEELYPGLDSVISNLAEQGIQVAAYINPHLNVEGDLFLEADTLGYLLKNDQGETYRQDFGGFLAGTIDFSNPLAKQWYADLIQKNIIEFGFKGFMADFGEYTPIEAVSESSDPYEFHNLLPVLWASTVRLALEQSGTLNSVLPWARSGFTGAQYFHSMMWAGDQNVDWSKSDGLPSSIVAALSLGLSGFGLSHSDIGGYTTLNGILTRSEELLLRWAEYSVFTPLMRTHEGNKPELNHQVYSTNETLKSFARLSAIYTSLTPYHQEVVSQVSTLGTPAMSPLFLHFPEDLETFEIQYEFMYGFDLLVAPVLEPSKSNQEVYLPSSRWIHFWDDDQQVVEGPTSITINATLGKTPVFFRADSKWAPLFSDIRNRFNY